MKNQNYEVPVLEIVELSECDILTGSNGIQLPDMEL